MFLEQNMFTIDLEVNTMDKERKRQLLEEYKNRCPEMGIISFCCINTGESFLGISTDTRADFNSIRCRLTTSWHPCKRLQALWDQYGESGFTSSVIRVLKYEDPKADHSKALEKLMADCLAADTMARRMHK